MPEEQIPELDPSTWERTRKAMLIGSASVSTLLYGLSELHDLPRSSLVVLDVQQHAAHLAPGLLMGYGVKALVEEVPFWFNRYAHEISIATVAVAGALFETQVSDFLWYRNTTKDVFDFVYTAVAGVVGAYCLRRRNRKQ